MKTNWFRTRLFAAGVLLVITGPMLVHGQVNSWTNNDAGKWEAPSNWSLGVAPTSTQSTTFITNFFSKTVTIDVATATNAPGSLTISNLTVDAAAGSNDRLFMDNVGLTRPLRILNSLTNGINGSLFLFGNSVIDMPNATGTGKLVLNGSVTLFDGPMLIATNFFTVIGNADIGDLTLTNSTVLTANLAVGSGAGSQGMLLFNSGTMEMRADWIIGSGAGSQGAVWMNGGQLIANSFTDIGAGGTGQMTISNGTMLGGSLFVGFGTGGRGTFTLAGGTVNSGLGANGQSALSVGDQLSATGAAWITGGQLIATNSGAFVEASVFIGRSGIGRLTLSNGTVNAGTVTLARNAGSAGTLTVAGGTFVADHLVATNSAATLEFPAGTVTLRGAEVNNGDLFPVGGAGKTAVLNLVAGTNNFNGGMEVAPVANSTGVVWVTGGRLVATNEDIVVGDTGVGDMTVSNGINQIADWRVAENGGSQGTLTLAGGTNSVSLEFIVSDQSASTGTVWLTGGLLNGSAAAVLGFFGVGRMTVSNGTWQAQAVDVGFGAGSDGALTVAGGTSVLSSVLRAGFQANATGAVWLTGGQLITTNNTVTVGQTGVGRMAVSNGVWLSDVVGFGNAAGSQGTLTIAGGTTTFLGGFDLGTNPGANGTLWMVNGQFVATNGEARIGSFGTGRLVVSNGTMRLGETFLGRFPGGMGSLTVAGGNVTINRLVANNGGDLVEFPAGTATLRGATVVTGQGFLTIGGPGQTAVLNVAAGTNQFDDTFIVAFESNATGFVFINGGNLVTTNNVNTVAVLGRGTVALSNGTWNARTILVGEGMGSAGLIQVAGGTCALSGLSLGDDNPAATGTVRVTGGQLFVNGSTSVGTFGVGDMTVSSGTWRTLDVGVAREEGSRGTLTIAGGDSHAYGGMTIGLAPCTSTGAVVVAGGSLFVTNSAGNATLDVRSGTLRLSSGTLSVDTFVLTNSCAKFVHTGGTLHYGTAVLNPADDSDGDGFPNQDELNAGSDPLDSSSVPAGQLATSPVGHWEITISGGDKGQGFVTFNNDFTASGYGIRMKAFGLHELIDEWAFNEKGQVTGSFVEQLGGSTNWTGELLGKAKILKSFSGGIVTNGATKTTFKWKGVPATSFPDLSGTWADAQFSFILTENADNAGVFDVADAGAPGVVIGQLMVTSRNKISGYATLLGKPTTFQGKFTAKKSTLTLKGSNEDGEKFNTTLTKADE